MYIYLIYSLCHVCVKYYYSRTNITGVPAVMLTVFQKMLATDLVSTAIHISLAMVIILYCIGIVYRLKAVSLSLV